MQDIVEVLRDLPHVVTPAPASAEVAAADVARGHRALMRRRRNRIAGSSLVVAGVAGVAGVAAMAVGVAQFGPAGSRPAAGGGSGATGATAQQTTRVQLVAYTGTQPVGFRVATVPAGWQVIWSDSVSFVVAPPGADPSPAAPLAVGPNGPAADGSSVSYDGRIAVMLQGLSELPDDASVTKVSVNGRDGRLSLLGRPGEAVALWLIFPDAAGHKVLVQVPVSVGLTNDQIVAFAQGITVTADARAGNG